MKWQLGFALLFLSITAEARLGETVAECKARYGEELDRDDAKRYLGFNKNGFIVMAFFDADLKCEKLIFLREDKGEMSSTQKDLLVKANLGDSAEATRFGIDEGWVSETTGIGVYEMLHETLSFWTVAAAERMIEERKAAESKALDGF